MALSILPYGYRLTGKQVDGAGTGWLITVQIIDGNAAVRDTRVINVGMTQTFSELMDAIEAQVQQVLEADSGSSGAFLDSVIAGAPTKNWVSGDPAYVPDTITLNGLASAVWTNMPAAATALAGWSKQADLSRATQVRFCANVTTQGSAGAVLRIQYSTDGGANWANIDGGNGLEISIASTGVKVSAWGTLPAAARADVLIRIQGQGGNGAADPAFGLCDLQVR